MPCPLSRRVVDGARFRRNAPRWREIVCSQHITSLSRRAECDRDSENTSTHTTPSPRTMEYLCVSSFSFFLSRLVVSTVVTALTVDASQPHYFYTTHTLTTLEYKPQRKKYTRARGKLGLLAASPDSRCTHATSSCPGRSRPRCRVTHGVRIEFFAQVWITFRARYNPSCTIPQHNSVKSIR